MRSPRPPRAIAAWLAPIVLYTFVFPVLTMLAVYVVSAWFGDPFSTLSQAPLLLSILYWAARFGDANTSTGATGGRGVELSTPKTARNYTLAGRFRFNRSTRADGFGVSPYSLYFFGLILASLLVYMGVVP